MKRHKHNSKTERMMMVLAVHIIEKERLFDVAEKAREVTLTWDPSGEKPSAWTHVRREAIAGLRKALAVLDAAGIETEGRR